MLILPAQLCRNGAGRSSAGQRFGSTWLLRLLVAVATVCRVTWSCGILVGQEASGDLYLTKIKPILQERCYSCHGALKQEADLRLDTAAAMVGNEGRIPVVLPRQPSDSELVVRLRHEDPGVRMPPEGRALSEEEIQAIVQWIQDGATAPNDEQPQADPLSHWAFQPPQRDATSQYAEKTHPIDELLASSLDRPDIQPLPRAEAVTLVRRVYLDLLGIPPNKSEVERFVANDSPEAYANLIDELLSRPEYGQRWGRHWMDVWRYSDWYGRRSVPDVMNSYPQIWRWRDWIVRSLNEDKGYDRMVTEMLAADELMPNDPANIVATGFLVRNWYKWNYETWMKDNVEHTARAFLGLSMHCAHCHDHKYDPIPQKDFYRLQAFFAATRIDDRPMPHLDAEGGRIPMRNRLRKLEDELEAARDAVKELEASLKVKLTASGKKEDQFQKLINDKESPVFTADERKQHKEATERAAKVALEVARYQPIAYSVNEVAPPAVMDIEPTFVLAGGERSAPGERVEPGFLKAITGNSDAAKIAFPGRYRSGRRKALAEWIVSAANPLSARVMANRIWQHHFGEGIVRTPSDFGLNGDRPSHPELLDWLALQFIEKKWSMKAMHRLMLTSNTYMQSTRHPEAKAISEADPQNRLLSRMNWIRLESEALRDSILSVSGGLNAEAGGPGMFFDVKDEIAKGFQMFKWYPSPENAQRRRSVYAFQRRSLPMPLMEVFDAANMSESCARRSATTVSPQALTLLNGELTATESRRFAERVIELVGPDPSRQIQKAFSLALLREPAGAELERARKLYDGRQPADALARLGAVLFNLNEFIYLE